MKMRTTKMLMLAASVSFAAALSGQAQAQDDLLFATDSVLNSPQLDIDGRYQEKPKETAADRVAKARRQLEKRNEEMVQKKIEDIRVREEQKLARQLNQAFSQGLMNMDDEVSTTQAAPAPVVVPAVVEAPAPKVRRDEKRNKILPVVGMTNIRGERIDFESKMSMGLSFENLVTDNFSVGLGLGYTQMDIKDYSNSFVNPFPYPGYYQTFGQGRNIDYSNIQMSINSKFFFSSTAKIRPFLGAAFNYNRSKLNYTDNGNNFSYNSVYFGNEGYSTSYIGATGMLGSEILFSETIGANIDFRYTKGLTGGFSTNSDADPFINPDQLRLQNISEAIESADFFSINIGLVVKF